MSGADALLASVEMTIPDGSVSYTGSPLVVGSALNVEAAPIVLVTWRVTLQAENTQAYIYCGLRDSVTSATYAGFGDPIPATSSGTLTASAVINLSGGDAVLELVCSDIDGTVQQWTVTGVSAYALTVAT